jgi:GNAT superfamily N-acetyltransferase
VSTSTDPFPSSLTCAYKLEDLYVDPQHRAHGIGKAFFAELGKIAQEKVGMCPSPLSLLQCKHRVLTV